jgi:hypothetical protein
MPKQVLSKHLIAHTGTCKTGEEQTLSMGVELQRPLLPSGTRHWKAPPSIEISKAKHNEICCMDLHLKLQTDSRPSSTSNRTPIHTLCVCILVTAALGKKAKHKLQKPLQLQKNPKHQSRLLQKL